ncbi:210_t:CDS:2 [Diversispora eburnea]|uniref:210_t:CDS:1 n=1 Tax=Diversispora eburnea TaxID=1213867 RepID=A0A9N9CFM3_9GLOM|nr:210_t:CDS:2 [Diversispora eburnea]
MIFLILLILHWCISEESHITAHKYHAELVAEFEALEKPLDSKKVEAELTDLTDLTDFESSNNGDDKNQDSSSNSKKYQHIKNQDSESTMNLDFIDKIVKITFTDEEISLLFLNPKRNRKNQTANY